MSKTAVSKTAITKVRAPAISPDERKLLGPAPLLPSENAGVYEKLMAGVAEDLRPRDLIEKFRVKDLTDVRVDIARYGFLKAQVIEQVTQNRRAQTGQTLTDEHLATAKAHRDNANKELAAAQSELNKLPKEDAEAARQALRAPYEREIEKHHKMTVKKIKALALPTTFAEHASAAMEWLPLYAEFDRLQEAKQKQFNQILQEIDQHRQGFGQRLRQELDNIIDAQFEDITSAPAAAPSAPATTGHGPQRPLPVTSAPALAPHETAASIDPIPPSYGAPLAAEPVVRPSATKPVKIRRPKSPADHPTLFDLQALNPARIDARLADQHWPNPTAEGTAEAATDDHSQ